MEKMDQQRLLEDIGGKIDERLEDYRKFAFKDNMVKMAIAFVMGAAFGRVVSSISDNLLMPMVKFVMQFAGDTWREAVWTPLPGLNYEIGKFSGAFIDFIMTSIAMYLVFKFMVRFHFVSPDTPDIKPIAPKT
jgi:large conductance mechanosensitive channel